MKKQMMFAMAAVVLSFSTSFATDQNGMQPPKEADCAFKKTNSTRSDTWFPEQLIEPRSGVAANHAEKPAPAKNGKVVR